MVTGARLALHRESPMGKFVQALSLVLYGGMHGWYLLDLTGEFRQYFEDFPFLEPRRLVAFQHFPFGIAGIGHDA